MINRLRERFANIVDSVIIRKPYPTNLMWFITERCNLSCPHCFVWNENRKPSKELSESELLKLLRSMDGKIKHLGITGGEPMLCKNVKFILQNASNINRIRSIAIYSNGLRSADMADILKNYSNKRIRYSIQSSLDGPERIHNFIRGNDNAYNSVIKLISEVNNLKSEINISIALVMTVSKLNYPYIQETINIAKKYNSPLALNFVRSSEYATLSKDERNDFIPTHKNDLTIEQVEKAIELWFNEVKFYMEKISLIQHKIRMDNTIFFLIKNKWRYPCAAGMNDAVLYPDGSISICEMRNPIGNIADYNFNYEKFWMAHKPKELYKCYCLFDCAMLYSIIKSWPGRKIFFSELLKSIISKNYRV